MPYYRKHDANDLEFTASARVLRARLRAGEGMTLNTTTDTCDALTHMWLAFYAARDDNDADGMCRAKRAIDVETTARAIETYRRYYVRGDIDEAERAANVDTLLRRAETAGFLHDLARRLHGGIES